MDPGIKKRRLENMSNGLTIAKQVETSTEKLSLEEKNPAPKKLGDTKKIPAHLRRMMQ